MSVPGIATTTTSREVTTTTLSREVRLLLKHWVIDITVNA